MLTQIKVTTKRYWSYPEAWIQQWLPILTISEEYNANHEMWLVVLNEKPIAYYSLDQNEQGLWLGKLWVLP